MPKVKIARKSTAIDMTAMCDVAFLLLTFFILTATARQPEPLPVDTPASTTEALQPDTQIGTITVGHKMVFFGVKEIPVRLNLLDRMSALYKIPFTEEQRKRFSLMDSFGVPISQLGQVIDLDGAERNEPGLQTGIPADSVDGNHSELHDWIYQARLATKDVSGNDMRISIKGDAQEEYPQIKKVMDILQAQKLLTFSLITSLRVKKK
jgi:biopolymer transport protein ExbD